MNFDELAITVGKASPEPEPEPAVITRPDADGRYRLTDGGHPGRTRPATVLERRLAARDLLRDNELLLVDGALRLRSSH